MRYLALASDYDGTLASQGVVSKNALAAVDRLLKSGRKLILVTGRELGDLKSVFPALDLCTLVIAENGGLLYDPHTLEERPLAEPPDPKFLAELERLHVPFSVGKGIVATWEPHQAAVLEAIQRLGLELQVSFNKGAVMVLPSGVNKETGLKAALTELGLSRHNVVGIGDAENDHAFLSACECSVAIANALPSVKERADLVTRADHGDGVTEIINALLRDDLGSEDANLKRNEVVLGTDAEGQKIRVIPTRNNVLFAGPSGSGKSTAVSGVLEQLTKQDYQFCMIDPEGDYEVFADAVQFGGTQYAPDPEQVMKALTQPQQNVIVNLLGVRMEDRPAFFASLFLQIVDLRARTGRPHCLVVDEAHHMLHASFPSGDDGLPQLIDGTMLITVHPDSLGPSALEKVDIVVAVGKEPEKTLSAASLATPTAILEMSNKDPKQGEATVWLRNSERKLFVVRLCEAKPDRRRHLRKYAQGELGRDRSFYFRGPENKLKLRAHNLETFNALAEGVDEGTWLYHLKQGDYSRWLRENIKDAQLAEEVQSIESGSDKNDAESTRVAVRAAIEKRYTAAS